MLWGLAAIIIPAFVLWGAGSATRKDTPFKYIGAIDGEKISFDDFVKCMQDTRVTLFLNYFNQPQVLREIQNDRAKMNRFTWEQLIVKEFAKKDDIQVSDDEVVNFLTSHPLFSRNGVFDNRTYEYILRNSVGMSPRDFEESVRNLLMDNKFKETIVKDVSVSDDELREEYRLDSEKAKLYYVVIDKDAFKEMDEKALELAKKRANAVYEIGKEKGLSLAKRLKAEKRAAKKLWRKEKRRSRKKIAKPPTLELLETDLISRADYVEEVGEARPFVDKAFVLKIGNVSEPIEIRKGYALIEPTELVTIVEEEFQKEKGNYRSRALSIKHQEKLNEWFSLAQTRASLEADLSKF